MGGAITFARESRNGAWIEVRGGTNKISEPRNFSLSRENEENVRETSYCRNH